MALGPARFVVAAPGEPWGHRSSPRWGSPTSRNWAATCAVCPWAADQLDASGSRRICRPASAGQARSTDPGTSSADSAEARRAPPPGQRPRPGEHGDLLPEKVMLPELGRSSPTIRAHRGLATAGLTDQPEGFPGVNLEAHVGHGVCGRCLAAEHPSLTRNSLTTCSSRSNGSNAMGIAVSGSAGPRGGAGAPSQLAHRPGTFPDTVRNAVTGCRHANE